MLANGYVYQVATTISTSVVVWVTFRVVHHIDNVAPSCLWRVQDALHETHAPHALGHRAAEAQAARSGELGRHGGEQHSAVVLRRDLHGLLVLLLGHSDVPLRHVRASSVLNYAADDAG